MDSLADLWFRSGQNVGRLYRGRTEDIVTELKAWVQRRKTHNDSKMAASWDMFRNIDSMQQLADRPGQAGTMMGQIAECLDKQTTNFDRTRDIEKEKARETLLAEFLLASLQHRRIRWHWTNGSQVDAGVCAFLGTVDPSFKTETELKILEDEERINQWRNELERRDASRAQDIANDPIPGVNTHPIGMVGARLREATTLDPAISTRQALRNAASGILDPLLTDLVMGLSPTGNTGATENIGRTTSATSENSPTPDHTGVYIADTLGNISISTGENHPTDKDAIVYIADRLGNITTATRSSTTIGSSTSTAKGSGTNDQTLPRMEVQDGASKISKAKKKREGRKRAEARAKEASANAEKSVGKNDDDDGKGPGLVDA